MTYLNRLILGACCIAAATAACSNGDGAVSSSATQSGKGGGDSSLQSTLADPAPEGDVSLAVETLAEGLVNPWSIAFLPDRTMLVTEREGRLRIIRDGTLIDTPVSGAPETLAKNQGGFFDVMPHPEFAENNVLFLAYAHGSMRANALRVARATFDGAALNDFQVIYEAKPLKDTGHHFGGRLVWGPDD